MSIAKDCEGRSLFRAIRSLGTVTDGTRGDEPSTREYRTAPSPSPLRIGELLVRRALINQDQLWRALEEQELDSRSAPIGRLLVGMGAIDEDILTATLAEQSGMAVVDLDDAKPDRSALARLPREAAFRLQALPLNYRDRSLVVALAEPPTRLVRREVVSLSGRQADFVLATTSALADALERSYPHPSATGDRGAAVGMTTFDIGALPAAAAAEPSGPRGSTRSEQRSKGADRVVAWLLSHAAEHRARSVHLLPGPSDVRIVTRTDDGVVREALRLPTAAGSTLMRRVVLASGLDARIALPQVGALRSTAEGFGPDLRVATEWTDAGRTVVLASEEPCCDGSAGP
jgi:type IV pilus assembly protein PilB